MVTQSPIVPQKPDLHSVMFITLLSDRDIFGTKLIGERLNLGPRMLRHSSFADLSASTIAFDEGFKDLFYFSRTFGDHYTTTPGRWRKTKINSTKI